MPETAFANYIWQTKYRYRPSDGKPETDITDTWCRIAQTLAAVERQNRAGWEQRFYDALRGHRFLPAGRIHAGAGTDKPITLFNCFVMGRIPDSLEGIFNALYQGAATMQQGGGVGYDFSTIRPRGTSARDAASIASGPVSFMDVWDAMCETVLSSGARRGAMMGTLRCDHPDIEEFVTAKAQHGRLQNFNMSVQVSDAFMAAVDADEDWPLVFPAEVFEAEGDTIERRWPGYDEAIPCRVVRTVQARGLWDTIMRSTYHHAEPGVLFIDTVNAENNLWDQEYITATNPCGEVPLPPYGACNLGSINLAALIQQPFSESAYFDCETLKALVPVAVRMLDNVIDASRFPFPEQEAVIKRNRRVGLGITGLADALIMLGVRYGSRQAVDMAASIMREICHSAYRASIDLAQEKGAFPQFSRASYLASPFIGGMPEDIRNGIAHHGIRNSHLLSIAPAGTISLLADNISSGLEPVFDFEHSRELRQSDGSVETYELADFAWRRFQKMHGKDAVRPDAFVSAQALPVQAHLDMQAALQPFVDNAVSKTINIPADYPFEAFKDVYRQAHRRGLKGCTTFRPNPVTGAVLRTRNSELA